MEENKQPAKSNKIIMVIVAVVVLAIIVYAVVQNQGEKKPSGLPLTASNLEGTWVGEIKDNFRFEMYFEGGELYLTEYEGDSELPSSAHLVTASQCVIGEGTLKITYKYDVEEYTETYAAVLTKDTLRLRQTGDTPLRLSGTYKRKIDDDAAATDTQSAVSDKTDSITAGTASKESASQTETSSKPAVNNDAWKQTYINYINQVRSMPNTQYFTFGLFYLDADKIPELFKQGTSEADGATMCTYANGVVQEEQVGTYGCSYIEQSGLFYNSGGSMDYYYDRVYKLENGTFKRVFNGNYEHVVNPNSWEEYYIYKIDDGTVMEQDYKNALNSAFDVSRAVKPNTHGYAEIIDLINNWR